MVCAYGDQVVMGLYSLFDALGNPPHFTSELIPFFPFVRISMRAGLIDRLIVTQVPVLIGQGVRLFGALDRDIPMKLVASRSFPGGLVQSEYVRR